MITTILFFINYVSVLLFGTILSGMFAGIEISKKNICSLFAFFVIVSNIQFILYMFFGFHVVEMLYPVITHMTLTVFLILYFKKSFSYVFSAILSAYLFTTPRRLLGTCFYYIFNHNTNAGYISQIILTLPLIFVIYKFIVPSVKVILSSDGKTPYLFSGFLLLYYIFSYVTTVYSNLLYSGDNLTVEMLCTICVVCYFIFSVLYYKESIKRLITEQNYKLLHIKTQQAEISLNSIKKSQKITAECRHDLRHHMHYLKTCLNNNKVDEAKAYIDNLCVSFDNVKIETYCENSDANLILSYYVSLAKAANITVKLNTVIPKNIALSTIDLCIILSNLLENSIKACSRLDVSEQKKMLIYSSIKDNKFYLLISNNYTGTVTIVDGIPQSHEPDHGIGVNSIAEIVNKYSGVYNFSVKDSIFTFKMLI